MTTPQTPAELLRQAAQRHQAARDAAQQVSKDIAKDRADQAARDAVERASGASP